MFRKWMKNRWMVLAALVMAGVLTGCSGNVTTSVEQAIDDIQNTKASSDGSIQMDDVILKVGDESVTYREVLFYIYQAVNHFETNLDDDVWDIKLEDGITFNNYTKEGIMKELTELKIIGQEAAGEGISLSEDEMVDVRQQAKAFLSSISEKDKEIYGFEEGLLIKIYADHALANKMFDVTTGKVDTSISDEEVRQYSIQYLKISTMKNDEDGKEMVMSDEEKKQALKKAKALYKSVKKTDDFYSLAKENTDDDTVELKFGIQDKPEEFGDAAMRLKTGETSEVITGDTGYYIIYCVSDNEEDAAREKKEEIIKARQDAVFEKSYTEWSGNYKVVVSTKLWKKLTMKGFKEGL